MFRSVLPRLVGRVPQHVCSFHYLHLNQQFLPVSASASSVVTSNLTVRNFCRSGVINGHHTDEPSPSKEQPNQAAADKTEKVKRTKTPIGKLDELEEGKHPYQEKEPLPPWPDNTNPHTGEVGGPRGPEPTRYGDWERKGRVSDF